MDPDDFTLREFLELLETYELRHLEYARDLLGLHHRVLEAACVAYDEDTRLTFEALGTLLNGSVLGGAFWAIVEWLGEHGLPTTDDGDGIYLHPVGMTFLAGYRLFGTDPDRWDALVMACCDEDALEGDEDE